VQAQDVKPSAGTWSWQSNQPEKAFQLHDFAVQLQQAPSVRLYCFSRAPAAGPTSCSCTELWKSSPTIRLLVEVQLRSASTGCEAICRNTVFSTVVLGSICQAMLLWLCPCSRPHILFVYCVAEIITNNAVVGGGSPTECKHRM
jgi:hypothetical protein